MRAAERKSERIVAEFFASVGGVYFAGEFFNELCGTCARSFGRINQNFGEWTEMVGQARGQMAQEGFFVGGRGGLCGA